MCREDTLKLRVYTGCKWIMSTVGTALENSFPCDDTRKFDMILQPTLWKNLLVHYEQASSDVEGKVRALAMLRDDAAAFSLAISHWKLCKPGGLRYTRGVCRETARQRGCAENTSTPAIHTSIQILQCVLFVLVGFHVVLAENSLVTVYT